MTALCALFSRWCAVSVLVLLLAACGGTSTVSISNGETYDESVIDRGAEIYRGSCQACHGASGAGGRGPSLIDVWRHLSYDRHLQIVRDGVDQKMPAFGDSLTDDEILAVVAFERVGLSAQTN